MTTLDEFSPYSSTVLKSSSKSVISSSTKGRNFFFSFHYYNCVKKVQNTLRYEEENFKHTCLFYNNIVKYIKQNLSYVFHKKKKFVGIRLNQFFYCCCEKCPLLKKFERTVKRSLLVVFWRWEGWFFFGPTMKEAHEYLHSNTFIFSYLQTFYEWGPWKVNVIIACWIFPFEKAEIALFMHSQILPLPISYFWSTWPPLSHTAVVIIILKHVLCLSVCPYIHIMNITNKMNKSSSRNNFFLY